MRFDYSFIIPVFNRPDEIDELLKSLSEQQTSLIFEVVVIEDGSSINCKHIIDKYSSALNISYHYKENSGPGDSRNYGMRMAKADYFIILDSDCILPNTYLKEVSRELSNDYVDFWGGPDAAHSSFSKLQKAINYSMTSFLTTGGIRGGTKNYNAFQPRSFNMGLSREAFETSKGFGDIHPGEDPDLVLRLWKLGFTSRLFPKVFVYHKRRVSWVKFYQQVTKFGLVRPVLNKWHPESKKITYWFPTFFILGFGLSILLSSLGILWFLYVYLIYFCVLFVHASFSTHSLIIGIFAVMATSIQFFGYGLAFLRSTILIDWMNKLSRKQFPHLFFN